MKKFLFCLLLWISLTANAQWDDKLKMADSLNTIAIKFLNKAKVYGDSADAEPNAIKMIDYHLASIRLIDSADKYIVWSEEEMTYYIKEQIQIEGLRLSLHKITHKPIDSSTYKMLCSDYQKEFDGWIHYLKHLYKHP